MSGLVQLKLSVEDAELIKDALLAYADQARPDPELDLNVLDLTDVIQEAIDQTGLED